jgi:hypothetical protein
MLCTHVSNNVVVSSWFKNAAGDLLVWLCTLATD